VGSGGGRGGCARGSLNGSGTDRFLRFNAVKILRCGFGQFGGRAAKATRPFAMPISRSQ